MGPDNDAVPPRLFLAHISLQRHPLRPARQSPPNTPRQDALCSLATDFSAPSILQSNPSFRPRPNPLCSLRSTIPSADLSPTCRSLPPAWPYHYGIRGSVPTRRPRSVPDSHLHP